MLGRIVQQARAKGRGERPQIEHVIREPVEKTLTQDDPIVS